MHEFDILYVCFRSAKNQKNHLRKTTKSFYNVDNKNVMTLKFVTNLLLLLKHFYKKIWQQTYIYTYLKSVFSML